MHILQYLSPIKSSLQKQLFYSSVWSLHLVQFGFLVALVHKYPTPQLCLVDTLTSSPGLSRCSSVISFPGPDFSFPFLILHALIQRGPSSTLFRNHLILENDGSKRPRLYLKLHSNKWNFTLWFATVKYYSILLC